MLYIVRGLPGAGKSTYVKNYMESDYDRHFEADMYFINSVGYYIFDPFRLKQAHEWCQAATHQALIEAAKSVGDVYVANTFTTHKEMQPYFDMAVGLAAVEVIHCTGTFGSIHNVPPEAMDRMAKRWQPFKGEKTV